MLDSRVGLDDGQPFLAGLVPEADVDPLSPGRRTQGNATGIIVNDDRVLNFVNDLELQDNLLS